MIIIPANTISGGYEVANSLRFNGASSDYLSKTFSTPTNNKKWTWSSWFKRSKISVDSEAFFSAGTDYNVLQFSSTDTLQIEFDDSDNYRVRTNRLFRDVSAWYHIVVAVDTTQSTTSNRVKLYVNGVQETSFSLANYPPQNYNSPINSATEHNIGRRITDTSKFYDGYMAEVCWIDGQQLTPTSFGEFDEDTNIWKPIDVSGLTFGTNGFYLDFENSGSLGADVSGNGNNFTVNNLTSIDQTTDTCTNNFATMNPLAPANISSNSDGNLNILQSSSGGSAISTFGFSSGKWYWEVEIDSQVTYTQLAGVIKESKMESALLSSFNVGANDGGWGYFLQGNTDNGKGFHNNSASSVYTTVSNGDILNIAVDSDNGKIFFGVNGTYVNSGDPANGTGAVYTNLPTGENLFPAITNYLGTGSGTPTLLMNFGNPPFSISSGNSDGNGYGNFEYAVPSGYYALNSKNLAEYG